MIEGLPAELVMADTTYDADHLRQAIAAKGRSPSFPTTLYVSSDIRSTSNSIPSDIHRICFSKLKQFRRVATRFKSRRG